MIRVLSVPHTGTRSTMKILEDAGLTRLLTINKLGDFAQIHFDGSYKHPMIYEFPGPVIISVRQKEKVEATWKRKGKDLRDMERMWQEMLDFMQRDDVYLLHVDNPNTRDDELQAISERIGVPLEADWDVKVGEGID